MFFGKMCSKYLDDTSMYKTLVWSNKAMFFSVLIDIYFNNNLLTITDQTNYTPIESQVAAWTLRSHSDRTVVKKTLI